MYENMTDREILQAFGRWYLSGKKIPPEPIGLGLQGKQHDYWNLYDYGGELKFVYVKSGYITRPPKTKPAPTVAACGNSTSEGERFSQSISRAKSRIFELAICNEFTHFCTFTIDKEKRDRYDLTKFRKAFAQMVRNLNRTREDAAKIQYLAIPEQHKDGAWHLHALVKGLGENDLVKFKVSDKIPERIKKQIRAGESVYNWSRYARSFGFFTATEVKSTAACSRYITKYITKDMGATVRAAGQHLYFASQGLVGRIVLARNSFDAPPFDMDKVIDSIPKKQHYENEYVKVITLTAADIERLFGHE